MQLLVEELNRLHNEVMIKHKPEFVPQLYEKMSELYIRFPEWIVQNNSKLSCYKLIDFLHKRMEDILLKCNNKEIMLNVLSSLICFSDELEDFILDETQEPLLVIKRCLRHVDELDSSSEPSEYIYI